MSRVIELLPCETIELELPSGERFFIKDAARGFSGFQIFKEDDPINVNTKPLRKGSWLVGAVDILYVGVDLDEE